MVELVVCLGQNPPACLRYLISWLLLWVLGSLTRVTLSLAFAELSRPSSGPADSPTAWMLRLAPQQTAQSLPTFPCFSCSCSSMHCCLRQSKERQQQPPALRSGARSLAIPTYRAAQTGTQAAIPSHHGTSCLTPLHHKCGSRPTEAQQFCKDSILSDPGGIASAMATACTTPTAAVVPASSITSL